MSETFEHAEGKVTSPDDARISRRKFLKKLAFFGAAAVLGEAQLNKTSNDTIVAHATSLTENPSHAPATPEEQRMELFRQYSESIGITEDEWTKGGIGEGFETGMRLYFGKPLNESLSEFLDICRQTHTDPQIAVPMLAYWGKYKIGSLNRIFMEKATNLAQSHVAAILDTPDEAISVARGSDVHPIRDTVVDAAPWPREIARKLGPGTKATRTIGFFDKYPVQYADAILHSLHTGNTQASDWDPRLVELSQETMRFRREIDTYKAVHPQKHTPYDKQYIATANEIEKYIVEQGHDFTLEMRLCAAFIQQEIDIIREAFPHSWPPRLSRDQRALKVLWALSGTDTGGVPKPPYFNEATDPFSNPHWCIKPILKQSLQAYSPSEQETIRNSGPFDARRGIEEASMSDPKFRQFVLGMLPNSSAIR